MDSGIFDVLADAVFDNLAVAGYRVEFYFIGFGHELGDDHRIILADFRCHVQEADKFLVVVADVHSCARKHV